MEWFVHYNYCDCICLFSEPVVEITYEELLPVVEGTMNELLHTGIPDGCAHVVIPRIVIGM